MQPRPPVIAILGHVDHGKTSLLDYIRKSQIAAREHGGITQRIGAYEIQTSIKGYNTDKITFIDTPGHEAFSQLRARGATIADIAILIIDAKDSLMPQTIESIYHIKNAKIPYIVVLNKMDLPDANPEKVKNDLLKYEVIVEDKGGDVPVMKVSAKTGEGVPELLEAILLIAADKNFQFDPAAPSKAYVVETKRDKRGIVASIVIKDGTLKTGEVVYNELKKAKIKALISDLGKPISQIQPSTPAELLGFDEMPDVGTLITSVEAVSTKVVEAEVKKQFTLDSLSEPEAQKKLSVLVKTDSQGSLEALRGALAKNENIEVVLSAVGDIHRSDIFLAKTSKAIVVGFNVTSDNEVKELAKQEKVVIKTYSIIYELIEELEEVSDLIREKEENEKSIKGEAKIQATFMIEGEKIYGVKITKGKINIGDNVELYNEGNLVGKTKLVSLKTRAKSVQEVKKDMEAGMVFSPPLDMKVGSVVKFIL
jgi:translation initiation factor IF-2